MSGGVKAKTELSLPGAWGGTTKDGSTYSFGGGWNGAATWAGEYPNPGDWSDDAYEYVWVKYSGFSGNLNLKIEYDEFVADHDSWKEWVQQAVSFNSASGILSIPIDKTTTFVNGNPEIAGDHIGDIYAKHVRQVVLQDAGAASTVTVEGLYVGTYDEMLVDMGYDKTKNHVLKVYNSSAKANIWDNSVSYTFASALTEGTKYTVSAKICAADVTRGTVMKYVLAGSTAKYGAEQALLPNTFFVVSETFTAGSNNTGIEIDLGFANGNVYIDDVSCVAENSSTNLVSNGDFETALSTAGWSVPGYTGQSISQAEKVVGEVSSLLPQKVTIGSTGWATMVASNPLSVPAEVEAYFAKYDSEKGNVKLTAVTDMYQWGRAVVKGDEGDYYFPQIASDAVTASGDDNGMEISWDGVNAKYGDGSTIYALGKKNDIVGFYLVKSGVQVPNGKPYLEVTSSGAREFIGFDDETTGINEVATSNFQVSGTDVFDLQGRRVAQPTRGLYIVNGKKVIIK